MYEIVNIDESKRVLGVVRHTSFQPEEMHAKIDEVWKLFCGDIRTEENADVFADAGTSYGIYFGYDLPHGKFMVGAMAEIAEGAADGDTESDTEWDTVVIAAGRYAKFTCTGGVEGIREMWKTITATKFDRAFKVDFEEYTADITDLSAEINIYISLK